MIGKTALVAVLILVVVLVGSFAVYETYYTSNSNPCGTIAGGGMARVQTTESQLGGVTEYRLTAPDRYPNAVTGAPDGTVWFAEDELPGIGHLFPANGTVVEYAWPGYTSPKPPDCIGPASVSGIALWNGRVWGADEFGNTIVGVNPSDGKSVSLNTTSEGGYPYWLAVGPDGDLWVTFDNTPARIGRITPNMTMQVISLSGVGQDEPLTLDFVNSSLAYISAINLPTAPANPINASYGHVYSFDPAAVSSTITPKVVGPGFDLVLPTSATYLEGGVWVAQHDASSVVEYNVRTGLWTTWPTSTIQYSRLTLPLLTASGNGALWFNEHYANKIARLDPNASTLVEFSESNPPPSSFAGVQNDLSIAAVKGGAWFTSLSGNYVGFADGSYSAGWSPSTTGGNIAALAPGGNTTFDVKVSGKWSDALKVSVSDSENQTSIPSLVRILPSVSEVPAGNSPYDLRVEVEVASSIHEGSYTLALTLTDGLTQQTAYAIIQVQLPPSP